MTQVPDSVLEALKSAIKAEMEGKHFYLMAARATSDDHGREVFEQLAAEEQQHADFLRAQYRSLQESGEVDTDVSLGEAPDWVSRGIFSDSLRERAAEAHFEMTALSVGIQLEADAQKFYRARAQEAGDSQVERFFLQLADWESGHYHALLRQHDALKEEYWAANQFAPF